MNVLARIPPSGRWLRGVLGVLVTAALAGCTDLGVKYPMDAPPLPTAWSGLPAQTPLAPDPTGWWKAFHDPRLDALVDRALAQNLDVAAAAERLRAARSLHHHADDPYLPSVRAKTDELTDPDASASFFVAGFDATWELGFFGRATGAERVARGQLMSSQADLAAARVSVVAEVVRDWIELRVAHRQAALLGAVRDTQAEHLRLLTARERLRLASPADIDQARLELAHAQAATIDPDDAADKASRGLAVLLGMTAPDPAWDAGDDVPALGAWGLDGAPASVLRTRPEVAKAESEVTRLAGELGLARADMYPSLGLGASMIWSTELVSHRRTRTHGIASLGPIIDIPLFDWGMRQSIAHAKKHDFQAAVLTYRQAVLQGVAEVQTAIDNLQRGAEREHLGDDALQASTALDTAMATRVGLRLASDLDRTRTRGAVADAGLGRVQAQATRDLAYVELFKAVGGAPVPADAARDDDRATR